MSIKQARINTVLAKTFSFPAFNSILTRKEFIELVKANKGICSMETIRDYPKEEKERQWLKANAFNHPFGNTCHPQTIYYNDRKTALAKGIFKDIYRAEVQYNGRSLSFEITKIEFDYFNTL